MVANKPHTTVRRLMPVETFQDWVRFELQEVAIGTHKPIHFEGPQETAKILDSFKQTPYYQELIKNKKVLAIYLVGSRSIHLERDVSDLDMIVILDKKVDCPERSIAVRLSYKGIAVHYNSYGYTELFSEDQLTKTEKLFVQQLFFNKEPPYAVYLSEKGKKLQKFFVDNQKKLKILGAKLVMQSHSHTMKSLGYKPVRAHAISKWLYHPIMACEILTDTVDTDFLFNLKSCTFRDYDKHTVQTILISPLTAEIKKFNNTYANLNYDEINCECIAVNNEIINLLT